jgi:hypothetical protein
MVMSLNDIAIAQFVNGLITQWTNLQIFQPLFKRFDSVQLFESFEI